jgi:hypothetical protein
MYAPEPLDLAAIDRSMQRFDVEFTDFTLALAASRRPGADLNEQVRRLHQGYRRARRARLRSEHPASGGNNTA